jgi:RHS repeat-associated protein
MKHSIYHHITILTLVLCLLCTFSLRAKELPRIKSQPLTNSSIAVDSVIKLFDDLIPPLPIQSLPTLDTNWKSKYNIISSTARILLRLNEPIQSCQYDSFSVTIKVRLTWINLLNQKDSTDTLLTVYYTKNGSYKAIDFYEIPDVHYLHARILHISNSSYNSYITLESELDQKRIRKATLQFVTNNIPGLVLLDSTTQKGEIVVKINTNDSLFDWAEEFDLEWTFVEAYDDVLSSILPSNKAVFKPRHNFTRVTIKNREYRLSNVFEKGYLVVRVRAVGYKPDDDIKRIEGPWSWNPNCIDCFVSSSLNYLTINEHEPKLNWQYQANFAEEGKRKEVVNYFDGSLRSRQNMTRSTTGDYSLIGETIYDHQGRAAIQVLPTPYPINKFDFVFRLNTNMEDSSYSRYNFDLDASPCTIGVDSMNAESGSSKYYSANNNWLNPANELMHKYIPDANHYPFVQTEFTPDQTGRIRRQSMPGYTHRMEGGKEVMYFYGTPLQEELDMMFGSEIGFKEHYVKEMVRDANGQYSISYKNPSGKVIATSLAGQSPSNLQTLPSYTLGNVLLVDLLDSTSNIFESDAITTRRTILVPAEGDYKFRYVFNGMPFSPTCTQNICFDCIYDLTVSITNMCGQEELKGNNSFPLVDTLIQRRIGGNDWDSVCQNNNNYSFANDALNQRVGSNDYITLHLFPGEYAITKIIKVNAEARSQYVETAIRNQNCKTVVDFENDLWSKYDTNACEITCVTCLSQLGTIQQFRAKHIGRLVSTGKVPNYKDTVWLDKQYNYEKRQCEELCDTSTSMCNIYKMMMLSDVSPSGLYGKFDLTDVNPNSAKSVFYANSGIGTDSYKTLNVFKNDSVWVDEEKKAYADLSVDEFIMYWQDTFADHLLPLHPEYCLYQECLINDASYRYDDLFIRTETYDKALTEGYLNPLGESLISANTKLDTFFLTGSAGNAFKDSMMYYMLNFVTLRVGDTIGGSPFDSIYTIWDMPLSILYCSDIDQTDTMAFISCITQGRAKFQNCKKPVKDQYWNIFRALYRSEKEYAYHKIRENYLSANNNACRNKVNTAFQDNRRFQYKNDIPRFTLKDRLNAMQAEGDKVENDMTIQFEETCKSYRDAWKNKLSACVSIDSLNYVLNKFESICIKGSDETHPFGSSSIPPHQYITDPDSTFRQVLIKAGVFVAGICDDILITMPMPYGHDYASYNGMYADTCACDSNEYNYPFGPNSGIRDTVSTKNNAEYCDTCAGGTGLAKGVVLGRDIPAQYACKSCITCDKFTSVFMEFDIEYSQIPQDTFVYKELVTNYLNKKLGFNLNFDEYALFAGECAGDTSGIVYDTILFNYRRAISAVQNGSSNFESPSYLFNSLLANAYIQTQFVTENQQLYNYIYNPILESSFGSVLVQPVLIPTYGASYNYEIDLFAPERYMATHSSNHYPNWLKLDKCACDLFLGHKYDFDRLQNNGNMTFATYFKNATGNIYNFRNSQLDSLLDRCETYFVAGGGNQNEKDDDYLNWKRGAIWSSISIGLLVNASTAHSLYIPPQFSCLPQNPILPAQPYFDDCALLNQALNTLYQNNKQPGGKFGAINYSKPFLQSMYETVDLPWLINQLNITYVNGNPSIKRQPFDSSNLYQRLLSCRDAFAPCALVSPEIQNYVNSKTFNNSTPLKQQLLSSPHKDSLIIRLNNNFNKPPYLYFFDSLRLSQSLCTQSYCGTFLLVLDSVKNELDDSFANYNGTINAIHQSAYLRSQLIARLNQSANTYPYLLFYNDSILLAHTSSCLPNVCELFMSITDSFITANQYNYELSIPNWLVMSQNASIYTAYKNVLNNRFDRYPYFRYYADTATIKAQLAICAPAYPCEKIDSVGQAFLQQYGAAFQTGYQPFREQIAQPTKFGLLQQLTNQITSSSTIFPYYYEYKTDEVKNLAIRCITDSCCGTLKNLNLVDPLITSLLQYYPPPSPKGRLNRHSVPDATTYLVSHRWKVKNSAIHMYYLGALHPYSNRDKLRYIQLPTNSRLKLNTAIIGITAPIALAEDTCFLNFETNMDDTMSFAYQWIKSLSFISLTDNSACDNGTISLNYSCTYYAYGKKNDVRTTNISVVISAFPFIQQRNCFPNARIPILCNRPFQLPVASEIKTCKDEIKETVKVNAWLTYNKYLDSLRTDITRKYNSRCLEAMFSEKFTMEYRLQQYHYTLYYYDLAGNLTKTVPPAGVVLITDTSELNKIKLRRIKERQLVNYYQDVFPPHTLVTKYQYNTLNQLIWQQTPDAGQSKFYYDALGRLVLSENARQTTQQKYSYTLYDKLGRITEVGELKKTAFNVTTVRNESAFLIEINASVKKQITRTYYDIDPLEDPSEFTQENVRNRVSKSAYFEHNVTSEDYAVFYSYDIHGNVNHLVRKMSALEGIDQHFKHVEYDYDLISGKVNAVYYQRNKPDQYIHKYSYDAENRLVTAMSGPSDALIDQDYQTRGVDAQYTYYYHGPLARTQLGDLRVQGTDYAYTIHGWLKGVNSSTLNPIRDMGKDGNYYTTSGAVGEALAPDVYGFELNYYEGDYTAVYSQSTSQQFNLASAGSVVRAHSGNLYNGNISYMVTAISQFMEGSGLPLTSAYKYDQLNRIASATYFQNTNISQNQLATTGNALPDWYNEFTYDANGNILTQTRRSNLVQGSVEMDSLSYEYYTGTNQLKRVTDGITTSRFADDIDNQTQANNYRYDEIGNLIHDAAEEIDSIYWNVYGKITRIVRTSGSMKPDLQFAYTPDGHRVMKVVVPKDPTKLRTYTYYVRDAQGNIMATYERYFDKIIDFDTLTYAQVNDSLVAHASTGGFGDFIEYLHVTTLSSTGLINHMQTQVNAQDSLRKAIIKQLGISYYFQNGFIDYSSFIQTINATHLVSALYTHTDPNIAMRICQCMLNAHNQNNENPTLLMWFLTNAGHLETLLTYLGQNNAGNYANLLSQLGITDNGYEQVAIDMAALAETDMAQVLNAFAAQGWSMYDCGWMQQFLNNLATTNQELLFTTLGSISNIIDILTSGCGYDSELVLAALENYYTADVLWDMLFDYVDDMPSWITWLREEQTATFVNTTARLKRSIISSYQQANNLYSSTGNGMPAYFGYIRSYFGQAFYDNLLLKFYTASQAYVDSLQINEWMIYGSSRLGVYQANRNLMSIRVYGHPDSLTQGTQVRIWESEYSSTHYGLMRGVRHYELSNHLGNVLSVVSDRLITRCVDGDTLYQTMFDSATQVFSNLASLGNPDEFYGNNDAWTGNFVELSLHSNTLEINSNGTTAQFARVNYWATRDMLRPNATYKLHLHVAKAQGNGNWSVNLFDINNNALASHSLAEGDNAITLTTGATASARIRFIYNQNNDDITYTFTNFSLVDITGDSLLTYVAEVVSATDYSPFGAPLSGRTWYGDTSNKYRFHFNGHEADNEVYGGNNVLDFGARIYNSRLGKFITLDPLQFKFPDMSPYCYAANSPIAMIDAKGRNPYVIGRLIYKGVEIAIAVVATAFVAKEMHDVLMPAIHNTMPTYTKYSPGYDWQKRQEKAAERFNNAKDIAIKKMIDDHFNQDPEDPKNFNKLGKGLGLTLGGLTLLGEVKKQLNEMKTELSQKADKTKNEMETIRAKGTEMTDTDKKKLSNLTAQYDNINQNLQAVQDAITQTDDLIAKEKQQQIIMSKVEGFAPADNTTVAPPVVIQP